MARGKSFLPYYRYPLKNYGVEDLTENCHRSHIIANGKREEEIERIQIDKFIRIKYIIIYCILQLVIHSMGGLMDD